MTNEDDERHIVPDGFWIDEPESGDCNESPAIIVEVSVSDASTGSICMARRCISEITYQSITNGISEKANDRLDSIKSEISKIADELENFVLIGIR